VQAGVDLVVDSHTAIVPGEGLIATAGLIDSHVHASSPQIAAAALSSGITTVVAMGVGGVWDVGANPVYNLRAMMAGWAGIPLNAASSPADRPGRRACSRRRPRPGRAGSRCMRTGARPRPRSTPA